MMTADQRDPLDVALDWLLRVQQNPEDGELRERLAHWLASDERHRMAWRQAERAWQVGGLAAATAPAARAQAGSASAPLRRRARQWWQAVAAVAACCVALLVHEDIYHAWQADYRTAAGERRELVLPDGSNVILDADSAIALDFNQGRREIRMLSGQAYFEVVRSEQQSFRVTTDQLVVTVTGTAFNIDSRRERVSVAQGTVSVAGSGAAAVHLQAGEGVQLTSAGQLYTHDEPAQQVAAWREGRLILRQERIAEVVEALRPYSRSVILLPDAELADKHITGVYDLDDPHTTLQTILKLHGGQLSRIGPLTVLRTK